MIVQTMDSGSDTAVSSAGADEDEPVFPAQPVRDRVAMRQDAIR